MAKSPDQHFLDWEASAFGHGYGTGEPHTIPALRRLLDLCRAWIAPHDRKEIRTMTDAPDDPATGRETGERASLASVLRHIERRLNHLTEDGTPALTYGRSPARPALDRDDPPETLMADGVPLTEMNEALRAAVLAIGQVVLALLTGRKSTMNEANGMMEALHALASAEPSPSEPDARNPPPHAP